MITVGSVFLQALLDLALVETLVEVDFEAVAAVLPRLHVRVLHLGVVGVSGVDPTWRYAER